VSDLAKLEEKYRAAQEKFSKSGSDKDKAAYQSAKKAFADERVSQRQVEEADPNHPRGNGIASVTNEEN
jgi:transposase